MQTIDWYRFGPFQIILDYHVDQIERTLTTMSMAIRESDNTIHLAEETGDEQFIDFVVDEETVFIETLLGTGFVLCQTYITYVVSHVRKLHDSCQRKGIKLSTTDGSKWAIMRLESNLVTGTPYSEIQVIDAFANYFKHHEEWNGLWATIQGLPKFTIDVLQAVGAGQFSSGNFRNAAERLGNRTYDNFGVFTEIIRKWGLAVHARYDGELQSIGILKV